MLKKYVTRTITFTSLEVLAFNTETLQGAKKVIDVPVVLKNENQAKRYIEERYPNDKVKVVSVSIMRSFNELYGMPIEEFLEHSEKLDPRKVKETGIEVI